MHLYEANSVAFVEDATLNRIADKIGASFVDHYRYRPPASEAAAWRNSLKTMADTVHYAHLDDHGVIVEWQLPLSSRRLDALLTGRDPEGRAGAVRRPQVGRRDRANQGRPRDLSSFERDALGLLAGHVDSEGRIAHTRSAILVTAWRPLA